MREAFAREVAVYRELGSQIRNWAPEVYAQFSVAGWDVLILEDLGPKSAPPWSQTLASRVVRSFADFHVAGRGAPRPAWLEAPAAWLEDGAHLWRWTSDREEIARRASVTRAEAKEASRWFASTGPILAASSRRLLEDDRPLQLLHGDARSDNLRFNDGRLYLLDWAEAIIGVAEFDVALFVQSIAVESQLEPETIVSWYEETNPLDPALLDSAVCAAAGFFADRAWRCDVPGLPRLRLFQRQQLVVTLRWALRRLGLDPPGWLDAVDTGPIRQTSPSPRSRPPSKWRRAGRSKALS